MAIRGTDEKSYQANYDMNSQISKYVDKVGKVQGATVKDHDDYFNKYHISSKQAYEDDTIVGKYVLKGKAGINLTGISRLCVDVSFYASKLKKTLDDVCDLVDDSNVYFGGDTRDDFVSKLNSILNKKTLIKDNVLSYVDDYNRVVSKFKEKQSSITFNNINLDMDDSKDS